MKGLFFALIGILVITQSLCWWDEGHMIVAQVAKLHLQDKNPDVIEFIEALSKATQALKHNKINSFVGSATWPDLVKEYGVNIMNPWHYMDVKYDPSNPDDFKIVSRQDTSENMINAATSTLNNWSKEEAQNLEAQFEKSYMLSYLTHVVGDLHNPVHCCELFTKLYPNGDEGGNLFLINDPENKSIDNLHKVWDSILDMVYVTKSRPLNKSDQNSILGYAEMFMNENPIESLDELTKNTTVESWIKEGWTLCKTNVYKDLVHGQDIPQSYLATNYPIAKRRIVLAGIRLSKFLENSYKNYKKQLTPNKK